MPVHRLLPRSPLAVAERSPIFAATPSATGWFRPLRPSLWQLPSRRAPVALCIGRLPGYRCRVWRPVLPHDVVPTRGQVHHGSGSSQDLAGGISESACPSLPPRPPCDVSVAYPLAGNLSFTTQALKRIIKEEKVDLVVPGVGIAEACPLARLYDEMPSKVFFAPSRSGSCHHPGEKSSFSDSRPVP